MTLLDIYDPEMNEYVMKRATVNEVAEYFKTSPSYIRTQIDVGLPIHQRFEIKRVENPLASDLDERWNDAVKPFRTLMNRRDARKRVTL